MTEPTSADETGRRASHDRGSVADEPLLLAAPAVPLLLPAPGGAAGDGAKDDGDHRRRRRVLWIALAVVVVLFVVGWFFHHRQAKQADEANQRARDRLPTVSVVDVKASPSSADLRLPGSITPLTEASIYARAQGYLKARYVDIGDPVRRGQVMAEIEAPDLDQEVAMARANVAQASEQLAQARTAVDDAKARVDLAKVTFDRLVVLVKDQAVAQQQVDQAHQDLDTARASLASSIANVGASRQNVRASEANAQRLTVLQGFLQVKAPFDGVVTARNIDVGALIGSSGTSTSSSATSGPTGMSSTTSSSGGSTGGSGSSSGATSTQTSTTGQSMELFRVASDDRLRVFVTVPQENAQAVADGTDASVFVDGFDQPFDGRVARTARSLDPTARTLLTEVQIDNAQHRLVPGMYAQVRFASRRLGAPLLIPGEAVIARAGGLTVAVIEDLRPEDRERLPKKLPADDDEKGGKDADKKGGGKEKGGKQDSGGGSGSAQKQVKGEGGGDDRKGGGGSDQADDEPASTDPNDARRIHLQEVQVGRDYGTEIEITRGLQAGATIVANPGDDVHEGAIVMPRKQKPKDAGQDKLPPNGPPQGNGSPSMQAPTKGRK